MKTLSETSIKIEQKRRLEILIPEMNEVYDKNEMLDMFSKSISDLRELDWSPEEIDDFLEQVIAEEKRRNIPRIPVIVIASNLMSENPFHGEYELGLYGEQYLKLGYLQSLNPDNVDLTEAIRTGIRTELLYSRANEVGDFIYEEDDPDALVNRFQLNPYGVRPKDQSLYFDKEYYGPSPEAVRRNRQLEHLAAQETPTLTTHDDYIKYFESFHPDVLKTMLDNMGWIELTQGCNASCVNKCALGAIVGVKSHIPFTVIKWLVTNYPDSLDKINLGVYYASDMQFYESSDREGNKVDAVDVIKLLRSVGIGQYVSVSFGGRRMIDFIYKLVVKENIPINRISRLASGFGQKHFDFLINKLEKKHGKPLSSKIKAAIELAFEYGDKQGISHILGNSVTKETPERDISRITVACKHTVVLSEKGFQGIIIRPASKKFPQGQIVYPINPLDEVVHIPQSVYIDRHHVPFTMTEFVKAPRFRKMHPKTGSVIFDEFDNPEDFDCLIDTLKRKLTSARELCKIPRPDLENTDSDSEEWTRLAHRFGRLNKILNCLTEASKIRKQAFLRSQDKSPESNTGVLEIYRMDSIFKQLIECILNEICFLRSKYVKNALFSQQIKIKIYREISKEIVCCFRQIEESYDGNQQFFKKNGGNINVAWCLFGDEVLLSLEDEELGCDTNFSTPIKTFTTSGITKFAISCLNGEVRRFSEIRNFLEFTPQLLNTLLQVID